MEVDVSAGICIFKHLDHGSRLRFVYTLAALMSLVNMISGAALKVMQEEFTHSPLSLESYVVDTLNRMNMG